MAKNCFFMVLFLSLCGLSNYADAAASTNTCWYDMKKSTKQLPNNKDRSKAMERYNSCNANHIREFIKETKKVGPNCGNLYKHLMHTDIFWMTRELMKIVDNTLSRYNQNKTIREYVRTELHEHCEISRPRSLFLDPFQDDIADIDQVKNLEKLGYDHMFNDFNALILNLSPCMSYVDERYIHNLDPLIIRYNDLYSRRDKYTKLLDFFEEVEKMRGRPNASLLYQSLYNFIDNAKYSKDPIRNYYTNNCEGYRNIQAQENKSLFGTFLKIQQEIFFTNIDSIHNSPPGYFPGHLPVFYSHMVSLGERSKFNLLNRPGIKPPEMINCDNLKNIFNSIPAAMKPSPYSLCNTKKCLAESSREETIWIFLDKLKQILNDKTSYNCGIK
jgi:hypothetical protein